MTFRDALPAELAYRLPVTRDIRQHFEHLLIASLELNMVVEEGKKSL